MQVARTLESLVEQSCSWRNFNSNFTPGGQIVPNRQYTLPNAIFSIAFSEKSANLVSVGSGDSFFRIFDVSQPAEAPVLGLKLGLKEVNSVACSHFIPQLYIAGGIDRRLWVIDADAQRVDVASQDGHQGPITKVVWHPRNKSQLATSSMDGRVLFYDLAARGKKCVLEIKDSQSVLSIDYNKYNDLFATGSVDSSVRWYDLRNTARPVLVCTGHRYGVTKLKFSPLDANLLATGS